MKAALGILLGIFCAISAFAQGTIHFANNSNTKLSTNSTFNPAPGQLPNQTGLTTGANHYRIGLYIAPLGTTDESQFTIVALATNSFGIGNGLFDGGQVSAGASTIAFQVRAWTLAGGATYETAFSNPGVYPYIGKSSIGFVTPAVGGAEIFGTNPGEVLGFVLTPPLTPEPSTTALLLLGAGAIWLCRHSFPRKR